MTKSLLIGGPGSIEDSANVLARALFRGDLSETQIKELNPQALHFAIKVLGLESSTDIISIISNEQYKSILDFELWTKDSFREDRMWYWLGQIDDEKDLQPLQKFLKVLDPVTLSIIIKRYAAVLFFEEAEEMPPNPNAYTPDGGLTWITLKAGDPEIHRLLGRLLAFLFQTNREAFYQHLAYAESGTSMEFEEEAFQEKSVRLRNLSIPTMDEAQVFHKSLNIHEFLKTHEDILTSKIEKEVEIEGPASLIPLPSSGVSYQPLASCLERMEEEDIYRAHLEFAQLFNSNLVHFQGDFGEELGLKSAIEKVFGAVNIGLEIVTKENNAILSANIFRLIPLKELYRLGLVEIYALRTICQKVPQDVRTTLNHMNEALSLIVQMGSNPFPSIPKFFRENGTFDLEDDSIPVDEGYIYSLDQIRSVKDIVQKQIHDKLSEIRSYEKQHKKHELVKETASKDVQ